MIEYEFWDELGNIFNAIVAYQQKTIEFNKRFVNPWLRLGPVLDQNDNIAESMKTHKKAIEIDPDNGSNWLALGDVYFKMGSWDDAADAYGKAIELNPNLGWAYANLALSNANRQKHNEAINLYIRSLEHITDDKDRAMIWNRLGNSYRKVNDYANASIAFKLADECDGENTGFQDTLDEVTVEQKVMPIIAEVYVNDKATARVDESPTDADRSVSQVKTVESNTEESGEVEIGALPEEPVSESVVTETPATAENAVEVAADNAVVAEATESTDRSAVGMEENAAVEDLVVDADAAENPDGELAELQALINVVVPEQVTQVPGAEERTPQVESSDVGAEVEEVIAEDEVVEETSTETVAETSEAETAVVVESVIEEAQVEAAEETLVEDALVESQTETVLEVVNEVAEVEKVIAEEKVVEETSTEIVMESSEAETAVVAESVSEETQIEAKEEALVEEAVVESQTESDSEVVNEVATVNEVVAEDEVVEEIPTETVVTIAVIETAVVTGSDTESPVVESVSEEVKVEAAEETQVEKVAVESQTESVSEFMDEVVTDEENVPESPTASVVATVNMKTQGEPVEETQLEQDSFAPVEVSVADSAEVTTTPVMIHQVATFADPTVTSLPTEAFPGFVGQVAEGTDVAAEETASESQEEVEVKAEASEEVEMVAESAVESEPEAKSESVDTPESVVELLNTLIDATNESDAEESNEPAYEEFLSDAVEPALTVVNEPDVDSQEQNVETLKVKVGFKVEPDSKNAHVWNELGNIYFNTGSYEDAVMAYTKAIEIDDWFAWPYSNLALVYVQKEKYAEAILLYQRSIELFVSDKDKAVTWNRLGNVYRRLNDYDNAIACYQRADELDPNNATRSLRSRFSLLGSLSVDPTPSLAG